MKCIHFEKIATSVGNDAFDHPTYNCVCHKKGHKVMEYECSSCKDREFAAVAAIPVGRCDQCRFVYQTRTPRAGYAFDYFCKAVETPNGPKKIVGYVEYDSEIPEIPDWCPYRIKEVK